MCPILLTRTSDSHLRRLQPRDAKDGTDGGRLVVLWLVAAYTDLDCFGLQPPCAVVMDGRKVLFCETENDSPGLPCL